MNLLRKEWSIIIMDVISTKDEEALMQKKCACFIYMIPGFARARCYKLIEAAGCPKEAYKMEANQIKALFGEKAAVRWQSYKKQYTPDMVWEKLTGKGINFTYYGAKDFPEKLRLIPDPPFGLFYLGSLPRQDRPSIAVIGARQCSEYGRCMAEYFARSMANTGVQIISGMAMGIDGISQKAALKAGGKTFGILGCGVDVIYPLSNERLYYEMIQNGGAISESVPGTEPKAGLFPQRNRIISALSDVVLVVEAREKSGTFITVDTALEQGREVYTIPGRCTDDLSVGCNRLIRQGAGAAIRPEDILEDMGWSVKGKNHIPQEEYRIRKYNEAVKSDMSQLAKQIVEVMDIIPCSQDYIVNMLRNRGDMATVPDICQELLELELKGIINRIGGQYKIVNYKKF